MISIYKSMKIEKERRGERKKRRGERRGKGRDRVGREIGAG
jgi:hypothetical protein